MSGTAVEIRSQVANGKTPNTAHNDDVSHLREWLPKQPHLPPMSDDQLLMFLHACYNSLEKTKKTIDQYYTVRNAVPELFSGLNPMKPEIQKLFDVVNFVRLPEFAPKGGYCVFYASLAITDPQQYDFDNSLKTFLMITDVQMLTERLLPGYVLVLDAKGVSLAHIPKINIPLLKKFLVYVQEAMPIRLKQIHIINAVPLVDKIYALVKPFLHGEIMEMIQFHKPGQMDAFHKLVAQEILPKELGGKSETVQQLHNANKKRVEQNGDSLQALEKAVKIDESKRPGQPKGHGEIFGMEGSFRKLDLD